MTCAIALEAFGVRVGVRASDAPTLEEVRRRMPYAGAAEGPVTATLTLTRESDGRYAICRDGAEPERLLARDQAIDRFEAAARLVIAERSPERVFVHAGVVGWKNRVIVIPGMSFSGKSTLVAALLRAGASYYSDEYAVCRADGAVERFTKPLELRREGAREQYAVEVPYAAAMPLHPSLVLVTRYVHGATWEPRESSRGDGVLRLLANTVSARRAPEQALVALTAVVRNAVVLEGDRGDADETAAAVLARASELEPSM